MTASAAPAGTVIASRDAGSVRIEIMTAVGGYTVNTWNLATQVTDWCNGYATLDEARNAANHARDAFKTHGTAARIDTRRNTLAVELAAQENRRPRRMHNPQRIAEIETELAGLRDLRTLALAGRINNRLAEAA